MVEPHPMIELYEISASRVKRKRHQKPVRCFAGAAARHDRRHRPRSAVRGIDEPRPTLGDDQHRAGRGPIDSPPLVRELIRVIEIDRIKSA
jgi:hypothetical protein